MGFSDQIKLITVPTLYNKWMIPLKLYYAIFYPGVCLKDNIYEKQISCKK